MSAARTRPITPRHDCFTMRFGHDLTATSAEELLAHLATALPATFDLVIEVAVRSDGYEHRIRLPQGYTRELLAQLRAAIPVRIEPIEPSDGTFNAGAELRLVGGGGLLRSVDAAAVSRSVLASLRPRPGETVCLQWVLRAGGVGRGEPSWRSVIDSQWRQLAGRPAPGDPKAIEAKARQPQLACALRVGVAAKTTTRASHIARGVVAALRQGRSRTTYLLASPMSEKTVAQRLAQARPPTGATEFRLTPAELAPLLGWPLADPVLPGLQLGTSRHLAPAESVPTTGIVLGRSTMPGTERDLALAPASLCQHVMVTSPIGTGKSTLLGRVALQAIDAGMGTVVLDWKGDLADDILDRLPQRSHERVVVIDPTAPDAVVGLPNPLSAPLADRDRLVDQLFGLLHREWQSSMGPRTGATVQSSLFTLARADGVALVDLPELLTNRRFRRSVVRRMPDQTGLASYWANFDAMSEPERAQVIAPTLNRTRPWLLRRDIRHMLGQVESTWRMDAILNGGVLIVNLASGVLGSETAAFMGALVVGELTTAIHRRARQRQDRRRPAVVILDEFQHMLGVSTGFADDLVAARGLGVAFVMAHQNLAQLPADVREAVAANARTRLAFQLQSGDAAALARDLAVSPGDLQHLNAFEAIARVATAAGVSSPVSMVTLPFSRRLGSRAAVLRASQQRYAVKRSEIDRQMGERYSGDASDGDAVIGARRRTS